MLRSRANGPSTTRNLTLHPIRELKLNIHLVQLRRLGKHFHNRPNARSHNPLVIKILQLHHKKAAQDLLQQEPPIHRISGIIPSQKGCALLAILLRNLERERCSRCTGCHSLWRRVSGSRVGFVRGVRCIRASRNRLCRSGRQAGAEEEIAGDFLRISIGRLMREGFGGGDMVLSVMIIVWEDVSEVWRSLISSLMIGEYTPK